MLLKRSGFLIKDAIQDEIKKASNDVVAAKKVTPKTNTTAVVKPVSAKEKPAEKVVVKASTTPAKQQLQKINLSKLLQQKRKQIPRKINNKLNKTIKLWAKKNLPFNHQS